MSSDIQIPSSLPQFASATTAEHPWPLRLLSAKMKEYISKMSAMWVEGEITQLNKHSSGKMRFFTLKDVSGTVSMPCKVMAFALPASVDEGSRVVVQCKPDFYDVNGSLALWVKEIRLVGLGDLLARIQQLREALAAEGLFDPERKKPLPFLPRRIGLITGGQAKAQHDVVVNARTRWPDVDFEIREVPVQGAQCVAAVTEALQELDAMPEIDVIVIARGGGSVEDLLPFSEERMVRAVAAAHTPVVSAIGHESDNPILDNVADFRASTPTDAAKRIVPDVAEERQIISEGLSRGRLAIDRMLGRVQDEIDALRSRPVLAYPSQFIVTPRREEIRQLTAALHTQTSWIVERAGADLDALRGNLRALSPQSTLDRGYAVLRTRTHVVRSDSDVSIGDRLEAILADGRLGVEVIASTRTSTESATKGGEPS